MNYYVKIKSDLLGLASIIGTPTGKTRLKDDGEVEAELICISPGSNCEKIWITKHQIVKEP